MAYSRRSSQTLQRCCDRDGTEVVAGEPHGQRRLESSRDPYLQFSVFPGKTRTQVVIRMDRAVIGGRDWIPTGSLFVDLRADDLVGLTPPAAALKVLRHIAVPLRLAVVSPNRPEAPAPPEGVTGAAVQVPGQLPLPLE